MRAGQPRHLFRERHQGPAHQGTRHLSCRAVVGQRSLLTSISHVRLVKVDCGTLSVTSPEHLPGGMLGARAAGSSLTRPTLRVVLGGGAAMLITVAVGHLTHLAGA
jgi:hypothetical protein